MQSTTTASPKAMNEHAAAEYIGMNVGWLRKNRNADFTPPYLRYGVKTIRYHRADLDAWMDAQRVTACGNAPGRTVGNGSVTR